MSNWKTWEVAPVFMKQNLSARGTAARRSVLLWGWVPTVEVMILLSSAANGNFDLKNLKYCNHILSGMRIDDVAIFKSTSEQKQSKL